jgi:predicted ABC-type ATPase
MTRPRVVVVAGPSGSGKSSHFPVEGGSIDGFNVDARAAAHNGGSFRHIPHAVRARAQRECEAFIEEHLTAGKSFAVETTLRSGIAIEQARRAQSVGFEADMIFITAGRADECVARVRLRGLTGGHAAPEGELRDIYARSMANLILAAEGFDRVDLYDASARGAPPRLVGRVAAGRFVALVAPLPDWMPERFK